MSPLSTESAEKVRSLLEEIARLDDAERVALLDGLGLCAAIRPWADAGASTVELPRPSRAVPLEPVVRNSACGAAPAPAPAPDAITGCPWCRRPVSVELGAFPMVASASTTMSDEPLSVLNGLPRSASRRAYVTLLYGKRCSSYFLGALVLAHGLRAKRCCDDREAVDPHEARRILMHTAEVPAIFLQLLRTAGWELHEVEHAKAVSFLFRQGNRSRFRNVFTKLRALKLPDLDVVMLLDTDLLIRHAIPSGQAHGAPKDIREPLSGLFDLRPPAAMLRARRGCPEPSHGERLPYTAIWSHPEWRKLGDVPVHQQACGINAGVMVLRPDPVAFEAMEAELRDWFHPEHYTTMMPEQEYLGRFYGTFDYWTHMDCKFNFEVRGWWPFTEADGEQGPPVDYGNAHEAIRQGGALGHPGAVVLHFSGHWVKPWDLLYEEWSWRLQGPQPDAFKVRSLADLPPLLAKLRSSDPCWFPQGYVDTERVYDAMLEWLDQLQAAAEDLRAAGGGDLFEVLHGEAVAARAALDEAEAQAWAAWEEEATGAEDGRQGDSRCASEGDAEGHA